MTAVLESPRAGSLEEAREAIRRLEAGESFTLDHPITIDEYFDLVDEETRNTQLINGGIYCISSPSDPHEALQLWLSILLSQFVEERGLGVARGSRSGVRVGNTSLREPDVAFWSTDHLHRMTRKGVHDAPDFLIEIVDSPEARRDGISKRAQYELAGVGEMWLIDLPRKEVLVLRLGETGFVSAAPEAEGWVSSERVPGFRLRSEWLLSPEARPRAYQLMQRLLAGSTDAHETL